MKEHYDIGVVGCWYWGNYGSLLNGYATFQILKSLGLSVLNIVTPNNGFEPHTKKFFEAVYTDDVISPVLPFERLFEYNSNCGMFLTGSDQIWHFEKTEHPEYARFFRLDFADDAKRKVSFATSFGNYKPEDNENKAVFKSLYERYSAISVRENVGVDILRDGFGINATQIMEPVLNLDTNLWYDLSERSSFKKESEPYLLTYILDPTAEKRNAIQFYANKLGIKTINILDGFSRAYESNKSKLDLQGTLPNLWCADFLKYYINASFVITDSFHGATFALIFNKPFIAIANYGRGISRFETLLDKVNMRNRLVDNKEIPKDEKYLYHVDFGYANKVISAERERSVEWLRNALFSSKLPPIKIKNNVTAILPESLCTGCGACVSACPVNSVELKSDKYGVYRSLINGAVCINCGLCKKVCAALELPANLNCSRPLTYAFICADNDMLMRSSSGGASPVFAQEVIKRGGLVVGAAWRDDFSVEHIVAETEEDLLKLQKSKYLQSYLGNIFARIQKYLKDGRMVMFVSTPCHVAGLKKFLGKNYSNLLLVDLLCANIPSSMFFQKYLNDCFGSESVTDYTFRHKQNDIWNCYTVTITIGNGSEESIVRTEKADDDYQSMFHSLLLRSSHCGKCQYQGLPRVGDLTIGDCWGIEHIDPTVDKSKGVSVILVNNEKGQDFLDSIPRESIALLKSEPLDSIKKYNNCAFQQRRNWPINPKREKFHEEILLKPFSEARTAAESVNL